MIASLKTLKRPEALSDRVYATLREYLNTGRIPAGQALPEAMLAARLGVSRTPVREALARLASEGLVVVEGRSFVLPDLGHRDIEDIYELRFLLEPQALRAVAAMKPDRRALQPLEKSLEDMLAAHDAGEAAVFMDANYRFRAAWTALVPNQRLVRAIELYADHVRSLRKLTLGDPAVRAVVLRGLQHIAAALASGDGDDVAAAMVEHLGEAKKSLLGAIVAQPNRQEAQ